MQLLSMRRVLGDRKARLVKELSALFPITLQRSSLCIAGVKLDLGQGLFSVPLSLAVDFWGPSSVMH